MNVRRLVPLVALLLVMVACSDTNINSPTDVNSPTGPSAPPSTGSSRSADLIQFRVSGNATTARVRFSTSVDGLTQVITSLPFVVSIPSTAPSLFISLEATPIDFPFFQQFPFTSAQIFVNGALFREATSGDTFTTVTASGTWRR